jgi:hypothetical protein
MTDDTEKPDSPLGGLAWQALVMAAMADRHPDKDTDETAPGMTLEQAEAWALKLPTAVKQARRDRRKRAEQDV